MKQQNFTDLPSLSMYRYENFFNIYSDKNGNRFYNLIKSINVVASQNTDVEDVYYTKPNDTWPLISYKYYNTMELWWLVCAYNDISNPTKMPELGTQIKLLKPSYVSFVIGQLSTN